MQLKAHWPCESETVTPFRLFDNGLTYFMKFTFPIHVLAEENYELGLQSPSIE